MNLITTAYQGREPPMEEHELISGSEVGGAALGKFRPGSDSCRPSRVAQQALLVCRPARNTCRDSRIADVDLDERQARFQETSPAPHPGGFLDDMRSAYFK